MTFTISRAAELTGDWPADMPPCKQAIRLISVWVVEIDSLASLKALAEEVNNDLVVSFADASIVVYDAYLES